MNVSKKWLNKKHISVKERPTNINRPKTGLCLVCLSSVFILWAPIHLFWLALVPGTFAFMGIVFGVLVLACGLIGWFLPEYIRIIGLFSMILSVLSLIGALGGLLMGTILGIIGGALCFSWSKKVVCKEEETVSESNRKKLEVNI